MTDIARPTQAHPTSAASPSGAATPAAATAPGAPTRRYDRSIVEGSLGQAVWKIAWPTMLTNIIGGLQGIVDHVLVGHLVGFTANAAIGVSWQIFIVVIAFISSLFTGMSVLVARFAGAGDEEKVDRTVYQAFLTGMGISVLIMAPVGYFLSPILLASSKYWMQPSLRPNASASMQHRLASCSRCRFAWRATCRNISFHYGKLRGAAASRCGI